MELNKYIGKVLQVKILDENEGKKTIQVANTKYGENGLVTEYDTQVKNKLTTGNGEYPLGEGYYVIVKVKNSSPTLLEVLINSEQETIQYQTVKMVPRGN